MAPQQRRGLQGQGQVDGGSGGGWRRGSRWARGAHRRPASRRSCSHLGGRSGRERGNPKVERVAAWGRAGAPAGSANCTSGTDPVLAQPWRALLRALLSGSMLSWLPSAQGPHMGLFAAHLRSIQLGQTPKWTSGRSGRSGSARTGRGRSWAPRLRAPPSRETREPTHTARMTTAVSSPGAAAAWVCRCAGGVRDARPGPLAALPTPPRSPRNHCGGAAGLRDRRGASHLRRPART